MSRSTAGGSLERQCCTVWAATARNGCWQQPPRCSVACRNELPAPSCHSVDGKPLFVSDGSVAGIASTSRNLDIGAGSAVSRTMR